ncbi:MAG: OmpA family protein [Bacteroidetes bacterium]|nr:OmpA family protein [Bacteroidota bacterium]
MKTKKHLLASMLFILLTMTAFSQDLKPHYPVSGGVLGALNYTQFKIKNVTTIDYKNDIGYAFGAFLNFPLGRTFSFEPQVQYSLLNYTLAAPATGQLQGSISYISVPVLLKLHTGSKMAIILGPQFDFLNAVKDNNNNFKNADFKKNSTALTAGLEFFPHSIVQIYGRYIYGLDNMDGTGNPNTVAKYYNDGFQFGIKFRLFGHPIIPEPPVVAPPAAPLDTDGDGVTDDVDKCPSVAGLAKYNGCPVPDSDKDGVNDEQDKCPTVAGLAKYNGCPIPDSDNDGINDEEDHCPNVAGTAANAGCPDIAPDLKEAAKSIYFISNTAKFSDPTRAAGKLNPVVDFMTKYPNLKIDIEGHTDATGSDKINNELSQKRADAIQKFFLDKGISQDRLTSKGYGSTKPVADNKTSKGRSENRRVELLPKW